MWLFSALNTVSIVIFNLTNPLYRLILLKLIKYTLIWQKSAQLFLWNSSIWLVDNCFIAKVSASWTHWQDRLELWLNSELTLPPLCPTMTTYVLGTWCCLLRLSRLRAWTNTLCTVKQASRRAKTRTVPTRGAYITGLNFTWFITRKILRACFSLTRKMKKCTRIFSFIKQHTQRYHMQPANKKDRVLYRSYNGI